MQTLKLNRSIQALALLTLLAVTSCQTIYKDPQRHFYVSAQRADYVDDSLDGLEDAKVFEVGILHGNAQDGQRYVGVVSDIAFRAGHTSDVVSTILGDIAVDIDTLAIRTGARYYFDTKTEKVQPFLGIGAVFQHSSANAGRLLPGGEADDFNVGGILMAGVESQVNEAMRVGIGMNVTAGLEPSGSEQGVDWEFDLDSAGVFVSVGWSF